MNPKWKSAFCGLAIALALMSCEDRVAGTSVGTGNPTEIQVSFKNDSGSVPITGTMNVYASTQIPVQGFSPEPLLSLPLSGAAQASLKADAFKALHDSLWPKTSIANGEYRFNVVVTGENHGTIMKGLAFRKKEADFILRAEDSTAPQTGEVAMVKGAMSVLAAIQGKMDTSSFSRLLDYHLFIYGTGYKAKLENGAFTMQGLPKAEYDGFLISTPKDERPMAGVDSATVFSISSSLGAGSSELTKGEVYERVLLPDSMRME